MPKNAIFSGKVFLKALILWASLAISQQVWAQLPQAPVSVLSPNAASLGTYGNVPVSLYTGTPAINIPLYEMKSFGYTFPISLSYHASGVRPDQRPGWVGLGWTLNAGGVITRNVKDISDDYNLPGNRGGYYYTYSKLYRTGDLPTREDLRRVAQSRESYYEDTEPDEFSFHFPGYNGKFYLNTQGNWQVQCDKPVKVSFNGAFLAIPFNSKEWGTRTTDDYGYSPSYSGFTITTEEGIQYVFGGDTTAIDYSIDFFKQRENSWDATAWYLTKIILQNGQEISLHYERGDFINQMYIAVYCNIKYSTNGSSWIGCNGYDPNVPISYYYEGQLIAPVYLKEIKSTSETIRFDKALSTELNYTQDIYDRKFYTYQSSDVYQRVGMQGFLPFLKTGNIDYLYPKCLDNLKWYKMNKITVKNHQGVFIKTIDFEYNNSKSERLMLLGIKESGWNNARKKSHRFDYDHPDRLPGYLSNRVDHWGFFNNTNARIDGPNYYNSRNPKAEYLKYGTLNKIVYPTGGYTEFEFEPHDYSKQVAIIRNQYQDLNSNHLSGGLRIKRITDYTSGNVKAGERTYFYVSDYLQNSTSANHSSGVLGGRTQYNFEYTVYAFNEADVRRTMSVFSSISVLPACYNAQGSHIGYSEIIEKREDNAFTRYLYTNFDNGYLDEPAIHIIQESRTPYEPYASKAQDRGLLQFKEEYNAAGKKIRSTVNSYEKYDINNNGNNYVYAMAARFNNVCGGTAVSYDEGALYKIYTYEWQPISVETTIYDLAGQQPINSRVNYEYTASGLLRSEERSLGDRLGSNVKTEYRYAADFGDTAMIRKNMTGIPVETITYRNGRVTGALLAPYRKEGNHLLPDFQSRLEITTPVDDYKYTTTLDTDTRLQKRLTYDAYDNNGNLLQYTGPDGLVVSHVWGYNNQYLIAEITGSTYDEVVAALGGSDAAQQLADDYLGDEELRQRLQTLRDNLPAAMVTTYTHNTSYGLTSETDPNGITTYYEYDDFGRLKTVRDYEGNVLKEHEYRYHDGR